MYTYKITILCVSDFSLKILYSYVVTPEICRPYVQIQIYWLNNSYYLPIYIYERELNVKKLAADSNRDHEQCLRPVKK
jgi:hypothetical protein